MKRTTSNYNALRGLGPQLDLLNTLNGGSAQATVQVKQRRRDVVIALAAPSLDPEAFDISLDGQRLTIASAHSPLDPKLGTLPNDLRVPLLRQQFELPYQIDPDRIEATFTDNCLRVTLPFRHPDDLHRRIEVQPGS